jgi:hypothetical protein
MVVRFRAFQQGKGLEPRYFTEKGFPVPPDFLETFFETGGDFETVHGNEHVGACLCCG